MKILIFILIALLAIASAVFVPPRPGHKKHNLLGEKKCTYGPSYWCQNLTNAGDCHATKHCIQTVWIHKQYPEDTTSICDTCKEMVKEARDQLESNETQELIKEVFEGSCKLLHLKLVVKECDKIADGYIPDLIDTLASEMNPQTVCAVAGLCNNPKVHQLLAEAGDQLSSNTEEVASGNRCDNCNTVMDIVVDKFNNAKADDFMNFLLQVCGDLSSFSDACSNIVITNFNDFYSYLRANLNAGDFCLLSGECSTNFHKHDIEITPMSKIGYVPVNGNKDDLPCELCEQLVTHLREVLVANTTEAEFKRVLEGLCKQTKQSFSQECLSIVDEYYDVIYHYLVNSLNATSACQLIEICPNNAKNMGLIAPLLPVETAKVASKLNLEPQHVYMPKDDLVIKVMKPKLETPILSAEEMQLPIDLLVPPHQQVYNQEVCEFCEFFLHFIQNEITDPKIEDEVEKVVSRACSKLPSSVNDTCVKFVDTYEPAIVAILVQEIDPSQICPLIKACPSGGVRDVDIFMKAESSGSCPLCLYAVTELESLVKGKKSKDEIEEYLKKVCSHLPGSLQPECTDFVNTYTTEIVDALIADLTPQEVCVYVKQCTDNTSVSETSINSKEFYGGDTETNVIYDDTIGGEPIEHINDEKCVLCEFVMKEIDDQLKNKKTDEEVKNLVYGICKVLPGTIKNSCKKFVDQYADAIIILLQEALDPAAICAQLKLCSRQSPLEFVRAEVSKCGVCKSAADVMQAILKNPKIDQSVEHIFEKTCRGLPADMKKMCGNITSERGIELVALLSRDNTEPDSVCHSLSYCSSTSQTSANAADESTRNDASETIEIVYDTPAELVSFEQSNVMIGECPVCKVLVKVVKEIVKHSLHREEVKRALQKACRKVHIKGCQRFLDRHFNQLVDLLSKASTRGRVCKIMRVCSHLDSVEDDSDVDDNLEIENRSQEYDIAPLEQFNVKIGECPVCKVLVKVVKEIVKHSLHREEVKRALQKACRKVHIKGCQRFLDRHFNQLVDLLSKASTRGRVCKIMRVCSHLDSLEDDSDVDDNLEIENRSQEYGIAPLEQSNVMIGECPVCKVLVKVVKEIVKHSLHREEVKRALQKACRKVHIKGCQRFLDRHFNQLVDLLSKASTRGRVCKIMRVCSHLDSIEGDDDYSLEINYASQDYGIAPLEESNVKIGECPVCKVLVKVVKEIVKHSLHREEVKRALQKACRKVHLKGCQRFLDRHFNQLVDLLSKASTRGRVCKIMRVCSHLDSVEEYDDYSLEIIYTSQDYGIAPLEQSNVMIGECPVCKVLVKVVKEIVKHSLHREEVKRALQKACRKVHIKGCQRFLDRHFNQLVDLLSKASTRGRVCKIMRVCSHLDSVEDDSDVDDNLEIENRSQEYGIAPLEQSNVKIGECPVCKVLVKVVKEIVKHSLHREEVKRALQKACRKVHLKGCQRFLDRHFNQLVDLLSKASTRGRVCKIMRVC